MKLNLARELADCGLGHLDPHAFRLMVRREFDLLFPDCTDEDMLFHLDERCFFVVSIRRFFRCRRLPDYVILSSLVHVRKQNARMRRRAAMLPLNPLKQNGLGPMRRASE